MLWARLPIAGLLLAGGAWALGAEPPAEGPSSSSPDQALSGQGGQGSTKEEKKEPPKVDPLKRTPSKPLPAPVIPSRRPPGVNQTKVTTEDTAVAVSGGKTGLWRVGKFLQEQVVDKVQVTGSRRFGYHSHVVEGDREAFNLASTFGLGEKRWTDVGSISLQGRKVLGIFNFDAVIQDNRFEDPQGQRFSLDYEGGGFKVNLGDIQGRLMDGNRFVTFSRTLRGGMVGYKSGLFEARALATEARGEARTVTIQGANSSGPYFLQSNQILRGSERIEVDGQSLVFGQDYTLDYDLGAVTFVNRTTGQARIIPPSSVITATYESFGLSGSRGRILGLGAALDFGTAGRLGISGATQRSGGEGRLSSRVEKFQGFGAPGTPYVLQFEPLETEPIVIRVDGLLQIENVDYTLDPANRSIFYFTRFMPGTSTIDVVYTPRPTQTVNGDRQVLGLDYRLPLGKGSSLSVAQAFSRLTNTPTPKNGTARSADLRIERGRATAFASWRSIPDGYAGIETTGFDRNETAAVASLQYRLGGGLLSSLRHQNSAISQATVDSRGREVIIPTRLTTSSGSLSLTPSAGGSPWSLGHTKTTSRTLNGESILDSTTLSTSQRLGRVETRWELNNQFGSAPSSGSRTKFTRQGLDLRGSYQASEVLGATFSAGLSRLSVSGETGTGRDYQVGLTWRPSDRFQTGLSYTDSDAGSVSQIPGFSSGYGLGFNGNGFSGGASGSPITGVASLRRFALTTRIRPTDTFSLAVAGALTRSRGSVSSNTESSSLTVTGDWDAASWLQLSGTMGVASSRSLTTVGSSRAVTYSFSADGAPPGRLTFGAGATGLISSGGAFEQNVYQADFRMSYLLRSRHRLALDVYSALSTGYQPQNESNVGLSYRYEIWNGLALSLTHRWRNVSNRDGSSAFGAYRSRGFDLELAFNFSR